VDDPIIWGDVWYFGCNGSPCGGALKDRGIMQAGVSLAGNAEVIGEALLVLIGIREDLILDESGVA